MTLPIVQPVSPMLAKLARELPIGEHWCYEPKWDGFRGIVFRDGNDVELGSRNERPLTRYFPELLDPLRASLPQRAVVDGEIVIMTERGLDFDLLSLRIHPAQSRIARLAAETPAAFVVFDLLALGAEDLRARPFASRRAALERVLAEAKPPVHLTPLTRDPAVAAGWFQHFEGAGLDGVVVKDGRGEYREGERGWLKVKHRRTADCVVAGFRWHKDGEGVGSLLLGLYDGDGVLHHVGVASSFDVRTRERLRYELEPFRADASAAHPWVGDGAGRVPGSPSRWNAQKDLSWEPLRIALVAEVAYEHLQRDRFRHTARFLHWRPDRAPDSCTYEQLDTPVPVELRQVFSR